MNHEQYVQWREILVAMGWGPCEAAVFIEFHLEGNVPVEVPQHHLPDDEIAFETGGSD